MEISLRRRDLQIMKKSRLKVKPLVADRSYSFDQLKFDQPSIHRQAIIEFPNGYGASIIIGDYTYGGSQGLYELAVLDPDGGLCYDTPITSDVIGYLQPHEVTKLLNDIAALPGKEKTT